MQPIITAYIVKVYRIVWVAISPGSIFLLASPIAEGVTRQCMPRACAIVDPRALTATDDTVMTIFRASFLYRFEFTVTVKVVWIIVELNVAAILTV